ncbi:tripartite tricarboxylate transporter substrate-binding protein [uncultured Castellaniella sp.]|uniref:Bug family tripartite tricarboxylate transporter substrate binding protein n=1 Tax=uncultured Castellaniella sp. TaxID=647907 RepID=UPI00260E9402|nr:tripartite tricarboxylate transporter substrate-binding protein [uncultured Castellaniella sp.]
MKLLKLLSAAAICLLGLGALSAQAEEAWPSKTVRILVPFGPGSTPDTMARMTADYIGPKLGVPVVVENKAGAGGNIGTAAMAKAAPDGYTFGITISGPLAANTVLFPNLPYQPAKDLDFLTIAATQPSVLVVAPSMDAQDVDGLLKALRERPGDYNYGSMGVGSISHLAMAALAAASGTDIVHVPYSTSAKVVTSILSGETQMGILPAAAVMEQIAAGKLRALAVATAKRSAILPKLPTLTESGVAGIEADAWMGFVAPHGTPKAAEDRFTQEVIQMLKDPAVVKQLAKLHEEPVASTSAEMQAVVQGDLDRWTPVIKANNIRFDN